MDFAMQDKFLGELSYKLDGKMRVVNPAYDEASDEQSVYLLISAKQQVCDRCVLCMNTEQFRTHYKKLTKVPKGTPGYELVKHILASVTKVKTDKTGKILIPRHLKEYAGINESVTFRATDECWEMWSSERLEQKRIRDLSDAEAYRDFARYMNEGCGDYNNADKYNETKEKLEREISVLELVSKRDALLRKEGGEPNE